jgi:hypothetical protein
MKAVIKILIAATLATSVTMSAQEIPSSEEQIPFACTFSKDSDTGWGDDDFVQIFFIVVPETWKKPVYIRVFDPDLGGKYDENHNEFNSSTRFSVIGGKGAHSNLDARSPDPVGNYLSGIKLATKTFSQNEKYDDKWYTFGPFNPLEGELQKDLGGRIFKLAIEGLQGDDGNLYRIFVSQSSSANQSVEGTNGFAYEYTFRLNDKKGSVAHLYPFVPEGVIAARIRVFDYDDEGMIRVVSHAKKGDVCALDVKNSLWLESRHRVTKEEINTSLDVQFIKQNEVKNNNIAVYITNQFGDAMAFYTSPIGGIPKYVARIGVAVSDD